MDKKLPMFIWGAAGALIFYVLLLGRNWDELSHLGVVTGGPKGTVIAIAGCVLVSALTGLLTTLVQPANALGAILFGLVPPALLAVTSIPRAGVPERLPGQALAEALGEKTKPFAVWTALNPLTTFSDLRTDRALAESAGAHKKELDAVRAEEQQKAQRETRQQRETEAAAAKAELDRAVAAATQAGKTAAEAARAEAEQAARSVVDAARAEAADASAKLQEASAETQRYATELATLRQRLATASAGGEEVTTLRAEIETLKAQAAANAAQVKAAATVGADLARLAGWYQELPASNPSRLIRLLEGKLRDRDPATRAAGCRLLVHCGRDAKPLLERALGDSDNGVALAAVEALEQLGG